MIFILFCLGVFFASLPVVAAKNSAGLNGNDTNILQLVEKPTLRVLFVGNSQTEVHNLPNMIQAMAASAPPGSPRIEAGRAIAGGMSLKKFWEAGPWEGTVRARIASEKWDYVVLQDIYAHTANRPDAQVFEDYAARFDCCIRRAGSKAILFATATVTEFYIRFYKYPLEFKALNDIQLAFGKKHGIPVAAAGYAWMRYLGPDPALESRLDLYDKDRGHPGPKGSYIYACLLYAVLTDCNPAGLTNEFKNIRGGIIIPAAEAGRMQKAAWEQYQENMPQFVLSAASATERKRAPMETIRKCREELSEPGKFTVEMQACEKRLNRLDAYVRTKVLEELADMPPGLDADTWRHLVDAAAGPEGNDRQTALRALIMRAAPDKIMKLADMADTQARLEPVIKRMRETYKQQNWQALVDEFKNTDVSGWPDDWAGEAMLMRGEAYLNLKKGKEAEADLKQASARTPPGKSAPFAWYRLAENYDRNLNDRPKAIQAYLKANEPVKAERWWMPLNAVLRAAALLREEKRDAEALVILEKAGNDKRDTRIYSAYIDALVALGRNEEACAWCRKMLEVKQRAPEDKEWLESKLCALNKGPMPAPRP